MWSCTRKNFSGLDLSWAKAPDQCEQTILEINNRKLTFEKMISSMDTFIGKKEGYDVPLTLLFQVDLNDLDAVIKRKAELEKVKDLEQVLKIEEFKSYQSCASTPELKELVQTVAGLQVQLNGQKIKALEMSSEERAFLIASYENQRLNQTSSLDLNGQLSESQSALKDANAELIKSEEASSKKDEDKSEDILVARSSIEKFIIDIETEHISFLENFRIKKENLDKLQEDLINVTNEHSDHTKEIVEKNYYIASNDWELAVDSIFQLFSGIEIKSSLTLPSKIVLSLDATDTKKDLYIKYSNLYKKARARQNNLINARIKILNTLKAQNFRLLRDAGALRSSLLSYCDQVNCDRPRGINEKNIQSIIKEIRVVPLRLVAAGLAKWLEIKSKVSSGVDGWIDLGQQVFFLFFLLIIPVFLSRGLRWTSYKLESIRKDLLSKSILDYRRRTNLAVWIARLTPFVPLVGMILGIGIAGKIIQNTDLSEISKLLYYAQIYYFYRCFRLLFGIGLELLFATDSIDKVRQQKHEIEKTAARISRLLFTEYLLLHITEDTVHRALAYHLFSNFIVVINIVFLFLEANKWQYEIFHSFFYHFPKLRPRLESMQGRKTGFFIQPFLFCAVVVYDAFKFVASYLIRLDLVKKILSEVLKKKLERIEKDDKENSPVPSDYLAAFDYYLPADQEIYVSRDNSVVSQVNDIITDWTSQKTKDDLVIIVGNRGMGKTTSLNAIYQNTTKVHPAKTNKVPGRILGEEAFYQWLSDLTERPILSIRDFIEYDKTATQKNIFFIDDVQNFFLSVIDGFNAYKTLLEIISLKTKNTFWCLTINSRSWFYLKGVLGNEHFYGKVLSLTSWRDYEIQSLILQRHNLTNYKRTFDESIKAYGAGDSLGQQAEAQFFRLLWGQSRGNPRSALMLWVSALSCETTGDIHIGVPSFVNSGLVATMSDDSLFLLAAIARHESLNFDELRLITGIERTVIRKCLKEAEDKELVWTDTDGKIRIPSMAQYVIDYYLIGKNFLYE